jgi:predicted MFS family arabinose efflux permease
MNPTAPSAPAQLTDHPGLIRLIAVACGLSAANLYYNQPLLADMARSFRTTIGGVGVVPALTMVGYAVGMLFIVPLGDILSRRRLVVTLLLFVTASMIAAALAPNLPLLAAASLAIGVTTCVPQVLLPFAAQITPAPHRGRAIGTVMMGLLLGILLSRTLSGFVGEHFGWRAVYWMGAGLMVALSAAVGPLLPAHDPPADHLPYGALLRSTFTFVRTEAVLQRAMLNGALIFAAFSAFWVTLPFRLEAPPLHYGTREAGLFGLVAAVGALAAPLVGRRVDRAGPRVMITRATAGVLLSLVVFWVAGHTLIGLAVGVIVLDLAVQAAQVTNMTRIYAVSESAPSRVNSAFMVSYFLGGSAGSLLATQAWKYSGWGGVCALGCAFAGIALVAHVLAHRTAATGGGVGLSRALRPGPAGAGEGSSS